MTKHVDDLRFTGKEDKATQVVNKLKEEFGDLDIEKDEYTNCGVEHKRLSNGTVEMTQSRYINSLKTIGHPELVGAAAEAETSAEVHQLYQSLLGAAAFTLLTQHWIAVYIISLQRHTHSSKNIHVRRLNAVVRALQKNPAKLVYHAMNCSNKIVSFMDAAFAKEQDKGYGLRGAVHMRKGVGTDTGIEVYHMLLAECKSLKLVTRSSFSSETLGLTGGLDSMWPLMVTLHEVAHGPLRADQARRIREEGGLKVSADALIDAKSVFDAVTASPQKAPAEKNLANHLFWVREWLEIGILDQLKWCDTRDMIADGLTKGKVERNLLLDAMNGRIEMKHEMRAWKPVKRRTTTSSSSSAPRATETPSSSSSLTRADDKVIELSRADDKVNEPSRRRPEDQQRSRQQGPRA